MKDPSAKAKVEINTGINFAGTSKQLGGLSYINFGAGSGGLGSTAPVSLAAR